MDEGAKFRMSGEIADALRKSCGGIRYFSLKDNGNTSELHAELYWEDGEEVTSDEWVRAEDADREVEQQKVLFDACEKVRAETVEKLNRVEAENERLQEECSARRMDCKKLQAELAATKEREAKLREALEDCMNHIDVDNLTMQTKYREWKQALVRKESDDG